MLRRDIIAPMNTYYGRLILAVCLAALVPPQSASADDSGSDTVGYYMKTQTADRWVNWISGIGVGFWVANKELIQSKRAPLFCFSGDYEPEAKAVLDAWIAKDRASKGTLPSGAYFADRLQVEVALLIAYEDAFPCKKP
jgi:hypothetical protein